MLKKSRFEPFFGDLVVVHRVHLWLDGIWKAHCQLPICDNWTYFDSSHGRGTTKRNLTKSAFFEGWVTLIANCRYMGTSPAFHLWTVRWGNDVATTLLLEVFTQRNFVADFFDKSWILLAKTATSPFGDLGVTHTVHLWLIGKRVVDFLLLLIELYSPCFTFEALWADIDRNCCVRKGGWSLWVQISGAVGVDHQRLLASEN